LAGPLLTLKEGITKNYAWIAKELLKEKEKGDITKLGKSNVVAQTTNSLDHIGQVHHDSRY